MLTMRYPSDLNSYFSVEIIDSLAQQIFEFTSEDALELDIRKSLQLKYPK